MSLPIAGSKKLSRSLRKGPVPDADYRAAPPSLEYVSRMRQRELNPKAPPLLMLAPMENLADRPMRRALAASVGGFDEACVEFMRVPTKSENPPASVRGVLQIYDPRELAPVALGAQVMGSVPHFLELAAAILAERGAPRIDLNCGCPANTVTGNGAGSSLLRTPGVLEESVRALVRGAAGRAPVSVKLRSGFADTSLFEDNLLAAQAGGAAFVTLHPRTKAQGYAGRADWSLTAHARALLRVPVVGNGDVVSVAAAHALLQQTGCHALMIGRGAIQDPLLFHRIRFSFLHPDMPWEWDEPQAVVAFLAAFASQFIPGARHAAAAAAPPSAAPTPCVPVRPTADPPHAASPPGTAPLADGRLGEGGRGEEQQSRFRGPQGGWPGGVGPGPGCSRELPGGQRREGNAEEQLLAAGGRVLAPPAAHTFVCTPQEASGWLVQGSGAAAGAGGDGYDHNVMEARRFGKLKKVFKYVLSFSPQMAAASEALLRTTPAHMSSADLLHATCQAVRQHWPHSSAQRQHALLNHMTKQVQYV